jgi:acyl-CoA reductase-like NAD-dependent aldehyde dehydrogenase
MPPTSIVTVDPATEGRLASYPVLDDEALDRSLERARSAALRWRDVPLEARGDGLRAIAGVLRSRSEELAVLATTEMGKPLAESRAEVEKCALSCDWYASNAGRYLVAEPAPTEALDSYVEFAPLGVLLAIMPWNFPFWQVFRAAVPALAAGNVMLVKHAESTTGCALAIQDVVLEAGLEPGVLSTIVIEVDRVAGVIADPRIAAVTLTGSTRAGRAVAAAAGAALKKTVLELGGSDAFVVLADAELEAAADWAVRSRFQNAGQSCIAAKRAIVERPLLEAFTEALVRRVGELTLGDPRTEGVSIGPLARRDLRDQLARQVDESVAKGAVILTGGRVPERPGWFYEPTVLNQVEPGMAVLEEEVFGPALPVLAADDAEHALRLANASSYGLGSAVWTSDLAKGRQFASRLEAGHTAINGMTASDPRVPFGGVKESGYGRELSHFGLREFVDIHAVVLNPAAGPGAPRPSDSE